MATDFFKALKGIRALIFDVDGVWTDGKLLITDDGAELRRLDVKDGYVAVKAVKELMKIAIISARPSEGIANRFQALGIKDVFMDEKDKLARLDQYLLDHGLHRSEVLVMGDDWPDYGILQACGIATCPADAAPDIAAICDFQSNYGGGQGCVRDVIERVLRVQGLWHETSNS